MTRTGPGTTTASRGPELLRLIRAGVWRERAAVRACPSKPQLAAVAHGQHDDVRPVQATEGQIAAAEGDPPLPEWRVHALRRPDCLRMGFEQAQASTNRAHGPACRLGIALDQETVQAGEVGQCTRWRPGQGWHAGGSASSPTSSRASQTFTVLAGRVPPGRLVLLPRRQSIGPQPLASFFTLDELGDRTVTHSEPASRAGTRLRRDTRP